MIPSLQDVITNKKIAPTRARVLCLEKKIEALKATELLYNSIGLFKPTLFRRAVAIKEKRCLK